MAEHLADHRLELIMSELSARGESLTRFPGAEESSGAA